MFWVILVITLLLSVGLIVVVLLQPSKGGGITAAFGGIGGSIGSTFGQRRTLEFLGKATTWTAAVIAVLCILANIFFIPSSGGKETLVTDGEQGTGVSATPSLQTPTSSAPATGAAGQAQEGAVKEQGAAGAQQQSVDVQQQQGNVKVEERQTKATESGGSSKK